ncbi:MAG: deoxyribose-phosphate aldolase [Aigarchaeota archaeon]|nr:deoxyribose-phosphate aldolase [Candidatus Geocrenenecus dongiae]
MKKCYRVEDIARTIDHTLLKPYAVEEEVVRLCREAIKYGFAAVCINPVYVPLASEILRETHIKVCGVVGFPLGATFKEVKVKEALQVVEAGASEIDMVMNISMFKSKNYDYVEREIREVKEAVGERIVKVIIECSYLTDEEKIRAAEIVARAGADYVKTSTGFAPSGAKIEDVKLLRKVLPQHVKIKAAGGIRKAEQLIAFLEAGADRIGTSNAVEIMEEFLKKKE